MTGRWDKNEGVLLRTEESPAERALLGVGLLATRWRCDGPDGNWSVTQPFHTKDGFFGLVRVAWALGERERLDAERQLGGRQSLIDCARRAGYGTRSDIEGLINVIHRGCSALDEFGVAWTCASLRYESAFSALARQLWSIREVNFSHHNLVAPPLDFVPRGCGIDQRGKVVVFGTGNDETA